MRPILMLLCCLVASPSVAAATAWQELAPGVQARLVSSDTLRDGKTLVGLEIEMPANTKTYWRVPGQTGFPAEFDLSGSTGIASHQVHWPMPSRDVKQGYVDYVYYGRLVLPLTLDVTTPANIAANVTLGVCSDICIPATASFELPLDFSRADPGNGLRLAQAMADVPAAWQGGAMAIGNASVAPDGGVLLEVKAAALNAGSLIVDAGTDGPLFGAPQKSPDANLVHFPLIGHQGKEGLAGKTLTITFDTPQGAFEVVTVVKGGGGSAAGA